MDEEFVTWIIVGLGGGFLKKSIKNSIKFYIKKIEKVLYSKSRNHNVGNIDAMINQ